MQMQIWLPSYPKTKCDQRDLEDRRYDESKWSSITWNASIRLIAPIRRPKVKPVFPSNSYPNYYALMTGLHPVKSGFIDDEMYDVKYKEKFSDEAKGHNHKHW